MWCFPTRLLTGWESFQIVPSEWGVDYRYSPHANFVARASSRLSEHRNTGTSTCHVDHCAVRHRFHCSCLSVWFFHGLGDRKSTRLNSSHVAISYAVFCLKKKKKK